MEQGESQGASKDPKVQEAIDYIKQNADVFIETESVKEESDPEPKEREAWKNKREYLLALVGLIIGFGNIWRFPYLLQKNGGAAFLIPCLFFVLFAGIPMFFLELAIGQRMKRGSIGSFNAISPYLTGVGISAGCVCAVVSLYYNTLFAWCLSYFVWSWSFPKLPWAQCKNLKQTNLFLFYKTIAEGSNHTYATPINVTLARPNPECELAGPAQYYWFRETLDISSDITSYGGWNWWIFFWQILAWIIVCLCLTWGTSSTGKVAYFTGSFPFVVLLIFLIGGFFLEDFAEGFRILFAPNWSKLLKGKVWLDAGAQIFFSLNLGFGIVMTFASYSPFHNACNRDAFSVPIISFATSIWASCVMFMILGFKGMKEYKNCIKNRNDTIYSLLNITDLLREKFTQNWTLETINYPHDHFMSSLNVTLQNENGSKLVTHLWGSPHNSDDLIYAKYCDKEAIVRATGSGTGLIFITFAEAVTSFPAGQLWAIIFFIMMISLGLGSSFGMVEGVISCVVDLKFFKVKKWKIVLAINMGFMFVGVFAFTPGNGMYLLTFFDELVVGWPLLIVTLCECISVSYFYGLDKLSYEIKLMTGFRPNSYLLICWKIISPLLIFIILVFSMIFQITDGATYQRWRSDLGVNDNTPWRPGYIVMALVIDLLIIGWIPLMAILMHFGKRVLKEGPEKFPEEKLKDLRNYDPEEDRRTTSGLQMAIMARSIKDLQLALTNKSIEQLEVQEKSIDQGDLALMEEEMAAEEEEKAEEIAKELEAETRAESEAPGSSDEEGGNKG